MKSKDLSNDLSFRWNSSIDEISNSDWENVFGKSNIKSQLFFRAIEQSQFVEVSYYYLQICIHGAIVSIVPCFCYELNFLNLTTSPLIKKIIKSARKIYPKFFKIKAFVTGTYAASCEHFIDCVANISQEERELVAQLITRQLKNKCNETHSKFIFIKDIRGRDINYVQQILNDDFHFFVSFPTTAIPIISDCTYPQALKKKNRKRCRKYMEKFDNDFTWEIVTDFSDYTNEFTNLYQNVLDKAKNKFEFLNLSFFHNINTIFPENSFLLIAKSHSGETRLMELVLEDDDKLIPLYLGINYKSDDTKVLYLNAIFKTVLEAERRRKSFVDFGQTSYYPKVMSGALVENIYYGFWSDHFLLKRLINNVFQKIFLPPTVLESVYLEAHKNEAYKVLEDKGFFLLNK